MTTLFSLDDYPTSADPVRAWRQAEAELLRLQAEDAADEALCDAAYEDSLAGHPSTASEEHPERGDDCPWCRIEARAPKMRELKRRVEELGAAALRACKD